MATVLAPLADCRHPGPSYLTMPRIIDLPAATLPLSGSELIPIETAQGTRKATVANLPSGGTGTNPSDTHAALIAMATRIIHLQTLMIRFHHYTQE